MSLSTFIKNAIGSTVDGRIFDGTKLRAVSIPTATDTSILIQKTSKGGTLERQFVITITEI